MMNPVHTSIHRSDGSDSYVIIESILGKDGEQGLRPTGVFKIYEDAFPNEIYLLAEPLEAEETAGKLPDGLNPDYLGQFIIAGADWKYEGNLLTLAEQAELIFLIRDYQEPDI